MAAEHERWKETFGRLQEELNGFDPVDGEKPLYDMEIARLLIEELGLTVTPEAVLIAIRRLR